MFYDEVVVKVIAGKGGDGCTSFRREKYVPLGGPNGGNGGRGASIIFKTSAGLRTLIDLKNTKTIKGLEGSNGKGSERNGENAKDIIIQIPCGTTIIDAKTNDILADLTKPNEEYVVCRGGRGGLGNRAFATHENPAPHFSELGEPGEVKLIKCELKVLADVGLVGMPSVGKSTLINAISNAHAKVGAYHFTTLSPNLGYVQLKNGSNFIVADLPGLIEGASSGVGLGDKFLKHAMRTKVIAHVLDMSGSEGRNPNDDFETIVNELKKYDESLIKKAHVVVANKMDLPTSKDNLIEFKKKYPNEKVFEISAINSEGLDDLINYLGELVNSIDEVKLYENVSESHVLYKYHNDDDFKVTRLDDHTWKVDGVNIIKLLRMTRFTEEEGVLRFARKLKGMGVDDELANCGAKNGDTVLIDDYSFEFKN